MIITAGCLLLIGCTGGSDSEQYPDAMTGTDILEKVPSTLSIDHLSTMKLAGDSVQLEDVLDDNEAYVRHAISYRSNGLKISGILNVPKGEGPFPLLIFNHGYIDPDVYTNGRGLKREQDFMARHGFAVLHTDYRGHAGSDPSPDTREVYDAGLEYTMDSINAILAMRKAALPRIDLRRIGMLGHSLGGGVTLNVLTGHPELVSAAVLYAPVHSDAWENFVRWRSKRPEADRTIAVLGTREQDPEAWDALSSQSRLDRIEAPILLFHGTADRDVPIAWSDFLHERLQKFQKEISYIVYRGEGHEFASQWNDFMERSASFFRRNLRSDSAFILNPDQVTAKPFGVFFAPATFPV